MVLGENQEFRLAGRIAGKLYAHQVKGVQWLWSLHAMKKGGILADDMGLGKTLQCSAFLTGMLHSGLIRYRIFPLCPLWELIAIAICLILCMQTLIQLYITPSA